MKKSYVIFTFVIILITIAGCNKKEVNGLDLKPSEELIVRSFVDSVSVEDAIGQLFIIGIPKDYSQIRYDTILDSLIIKHGIGGVFINSYTLYNNGKRENDDSNEFLDDVKNFISQLQKKSLNSKLSLPLFTVCDFENNEISPIQNGFELPTSAYSLAASNDSLLIEYEGYVNSYKLSGLGINMLLGPVLDSYNGEVNCLNDRCFGSNSNEIVSRSSYYIRGLKANPIIIVAKHFPGLGSVDRSPELKSIPIYQQTPDQLEQDIKVFKDLGSGIDGIMTSHAKVNSLDSKNLASFSKAVINKYIDTSFNNKIVISDDFSNMGAIRFLFDCNGTEDYSSIACKAFDAGNDLLLFSHINQRGVIFNYNHFINVKSKLVKAINSNDELEKRFRKSLFKIICTKIKYYKRLGTFKNVNDFLNNYKRTKSNKIDFNISDTQKKISTFSIDDAILNYSDSSIASDSLLCQAILEKSFCVINNIESWDSLKIKIADSILICGQSNYIRDFKNLGLDALYHTTYIELKNRSSHEYQKYLNDILVMSKRNKYVIIFGKYRDDADLAEKVVNASEGNFRNKLVFISTNNPSIVNKEFSLNINHLSFFTDHRLIPVVFMKYLNGSIKLRKLNVSVGNIFLPSMDPCYNLEESEIPDYALENQKTKDRVIKVISKDYILIKKSTFNFLLFIFIILISFLFYQHEFKNEWYHNSGRTINRNKKVATLFLFVFLIMILFFNNESLQKLVSVKNMKDLIELSPQND